jgi:hypothetical protein
VLTTNDEETKSVREAVNLAGGKIWKDSMVKYMESLHNNETWDLVELPNGINPIGSKWVFKKKRTSEVKYRNSKIDW